jgi:hypothetical protein
VSSTQLLHLLPPFTAAAAASALMSAAAAAAGACPPVVDAPTAALGATAHAHLRLPNSASSLLPDARLLKDILLCYAQHANEPLKPSHKTARIES